MNNQNLNNRRSSLLSTKFGDRVRQLRLDLHLTQSDLTDACGISSNAVLSKLEQNAYNPSLDVVCKLANALKCTVGYLIGETEIKNEPLCDALWNDFYKDFVRLKESDMLLLSNIAKLMTKDYDRIVRS